MHAAPASREEDKADSLGREEDMCSMVGAMTATGIDVVGESLGSSNAAVDLPSLSPMREHVRELQCDVLPEPVAIWAHHC